MVLSLSWFFAEAISGKADGNKNQYLERDELEIFLQGKVSQLMSHTQKPKLLPQADTVSVFYLGSQSNSLISSTQENVAIVVENGSMPNGLKHVRRVKLSQSFDLRFKISRRSVAVFNRTGDNITNLPSNTLYHWQRVINKTYLLKALGNQFDMSLSPIQIDLSEGDGNHSEGAFLHFSLGNESEDLKALTLFSLATNGELEFLYPMSDYNDALLIEEFPFILPPMQITKHLGSESLVVILCQSVNNGLHKLLIQHQPDIPDVKKILSYLQQGCQVGQYAVFSR